MTTATRSFRPCGGHRVDRDFQPSRLNRREFTPPFQGAHTSECEYLGKDFKIPMMKVLQEALDQFPFVAMDNDVLGGTPRIAGTRIPVSMVLDAVQYYGTIEGAIKSYPDLVPDQIRQALSFASVVLERSAEHEFTNSFG